MKILFFVAFVLAFEAVDSSSAFEQLAALTCEGDLFVLPNHPELGIRLNYTNAFEIYEKFVDRMYERLKCPCPSLTTDEFDRTRAYYTPDFWINELTAKNNHTTCFQWLPEADLSGYPAIRQLQNVLKQFDLSKIDFSTCNWDTYTSGQGCTMQLYIPGTNMYFQVAIKKCSSSTYVPYISLTCKGEMCSKIMMPCNDQQECGASRCHGFGYDSKSSPLVQITDLINGLLTARFYDNEDSNIGGATISFFERVLSLGRKIVYGVDTPFKFSTDTPAQFVDFKICSPPISQWEDDFTSICSVAPGLPISCPSLSHWDGKLSDGTSTFAPDRVNGNTWRTGKLEEKPVERIGNEGIVAFDLTCDGQLSFLPNRAHLLWPSFIPFFDFSTNSDTKRRSYQQTPDPIPPANVSVVIIPAIINLVAVQPLTFNAPLLNSVYHQAYQFLKQVEQNRATTRGDMLSDIAFSLTWAWEQFFYDWVYAPNGKPTVDHGPDMSSLRTFMFEVVGIPYEITLPPNTCSYERWAKEGVCSGDYTGFGELLGVDLTVRVIAKTCGEGTLPSFQIQCVGSACTALTEPVPCSSSSNCAGGFVCLPLTNANFQRKNIDMLFQAAIVQPDPSKIRTDQCSGFNFFQKDLNWLVNLFQEQPNNGPGYCMLNVTRLEAPASPYPSLAAKWAHDAAEVVGNLVKLSWFEDWSF